MNSINILGIKINNMNMKETVEAVKEEAAKTVSAVKDKFGNDIWPAIACLLGGLLLATFIKRPTVTVKVVVKQE